MFKNAVRLYFLIALEYCKRKWAIFTLGLILATSLIILQWKFHIYDPNSKIISQGLVGTYQEHDIPAEVTKLISQGLIEIDENGKFIPDLVSGWETNNDATFFKFKLKDHLLWSDGTKFKSSDLDIPIPNTSVSFPNDHTIEFKLKEAYSPFPSLLTKPVFKKGTLVGTGPYKVAKIEKSRIFITKILLQPLDPVNPQVVVRFYPSESIAFTGFALGEVQTLLGVTNNKHLESTVTTLQDRTDYTKVVAIFYNTKDAVLSNRSLRQALSFAAPVVKNEVEANNPYPAFFWAFNKETKAYLNKPEEAKTALGRAKSASNGEMLAKEIILTTTPQLESVGKDVVSAWKKLGLNAVLRVESGIPQNFQALLITHSIPADPDQYFLWHSTQDKTNLTKYSFARVDKDLEDGRKATAQEDRKVKYFDFQRALLEDSPATFLYFPKYNIIYLRKAEKNLNKILPLQLSKLLKD